MLKSQCDSYNEKKKKKKKKKKTTLKKKKKKKIFLGREPTSLGLISHLGIHYATDNDANICIYNK